MGFNINLNDIGFNTFLEVSDYAASLVDKKTDDVPNESMYEKRRRTGKNYV